jgi:signal transduction histidine kinase
MTRDAIKIVVVLASLVLSARLLSHTTESIEDIEYLYYTDPEGAEQKWASLLGNPEVQGKRHLWLEALAAAYWRKKPEMFPENLQKLLAETQEPSPLFIRARIRLLWLAMEFMQPKSRNEMEAYANEAITLSCHSLKSAVFCMRSYKLLADYYAEISALKKGMEAIRAALGWAEHLTPRQQLQLYAAKLTRANLLYYEGHTKEVIELYREIFAWYYPRGINTLAGIVAGNMAALLITEDPLNNQEISQYLGYLRDLGIKTKTDRFQAYADYLEARSHVVNRRYSLSIEPFNRSLDMYRALDDSRMMMNVLLERARSYAEIGAQLQAEKDLEEVKPLIPSDYIAERMLLLEAQHISQFKSGRVQDAYESLSQLYQMWKDVNKKEKEEEIRALTVRMGLDLEEEKNRNLSLQIRHRDEVAFYYRLIFLGVTFFAFFVLLALVALYRSRKTLARYTKMVSKERKKLQEVLDQIDEIMFAVSVNEGLQAVPSRAMKQHFAQYLEHKPSILEFLASTQLGSDDQSLVVSILQCVEGEDELQWHLNKDQLPQKFVINGKTYQVYWQAYFESEVWQNLFLVMHDITHIEALKRQDELQKANAIRSQHVAEELLHHSGHTLASLFQSLGTARSFLSNLQLANQKSEALRYLHGLKGEARSLGLSELRDSVHKLEETWGGEHAKLEDAQSLLGILDSYLGWHELLLGNRALETSSSLWHSLDIALAGANRQLQDAKLDWGGVKVEIDGTSMNEDLGWLKEVFVHGITNALDHGFILARKAQKNVSLPIIEIKLSRDGEQLNLEICDNGIGLDLSAIQRKAQERGWAPRHGESWEDFLMEDGVSTAASVSLQSGRGLGLAAIKAICSEHDGVVRLCSREGQNGSVLRLSWPQKKSR